MKNPEIRLERAGRMGKRTKDKVKEKERHRKNKIMQVSPSAHPIPRTTSPAGDTQACPRGFENVAPQSQMKSLSCCPPPGLPCPPWLTPPASLGLHSQTQPLSFRPDLSLLVAGKGQGLHLTRDISSYNHSSTISAICQRFTRWIHQKGDSFTTSNICKKDNNKPP